jgi:8-oxo-dGTP pyrophosphatase MutT (NUDIX family)
MSRPTQIAAVPVRRREDGALQVLLITSRETRRWVIPKGWPWPGIPDHEAAAAEAWEEAGVRGHIQADVIGRFTYQKCRNGTAQAVDVDVYLLEVTEEAQDWPEIAQRQRAWVSPAEAAGAVVEPELRDLLNTLAA